MKFLPRYLILLGLLLLSGVIVKAQTSSFTLYLNSVGTNIAVDSAEVAVMQSNIKTLSDENGEAIISGLEKGFYLISINHPKYADQTLTLNLKSGQNIEKSIQLIPQIDEILVTADRINRSLERRGFYKRKDQGFGTFLTPEEIAKKGKLNPTDILRGVSGVKLTAVGEKLVATSSRRSGGGGRLVSDVPCALKVFVDGVKTGGAATGKGTANISIAQQQLPDLNNTINSVVEIAAVEIYNGPSTTPPRFGQFNSCGAIVIWTESGLVE